jgi:hypothetical protein
MNRSNKRLSSRPKLSALVAAGVLAASAVVVTSTSLAQNRPDRSGFDRRDRQGGNGNGGSDGRDRQGGDRQGFDRQGFDRSRRFNSGGTQVTQSPSAQPQPAVASATTQPASSSPQPAAPPPQPVSFKPSDYTTKYVLLEQKNIFLKSRVPWRDPARRDPRGEQGPRRPEDLLVLRGIALQEGRRVAFVENTSSNTTSRLTPGSAILSGKIVEVGGDYIAYEADGGHQTRIEIGRNFAGAVAAAGGFTPSSSTAGSGSFTVTGSASASSSAAPADPNNPALSVEERMKLKRLQELQPKQ